MSRKHSIFDLKTLFFLTLSVLVVISAVVIPAQAQNDENDWQVYLFDSVNKQVVQIDQDGEQETFSIGLGDNEFIGTNEIAVDDLGQHAYYCVRGNPDMQQLSPSTVRVIEFGNPTPVYEFDLGETIGCRVSAVEDEAGFLAVGVVNYQPFQEGIDPELPAWQLLLLDTVSGNVVDALNANDPNMPEINDFGEISYMPTVQQVSSEIIFTAFPWVGMGGGQSFPTFIWNPTDDTVDPIAGWGTVSHDHLLSSDELVYPALDDTLAYGEPNGPLPVANTLHLSTNDMLSTIYTNEEWVIVDSNFVNNGQAVVVTLLSSFSMNAMGSTIRFEMIARDGTITELDASYEGYATVRAVPDGFIIMWTEQAQNADEPPLVMHLTHYPMGGEPREIWSVTPEGNQISIWEMFWATSSTTTENLPAFVDVLP